jgi:hypothetical protein
MKRFHPVTRRAVLAAALLFPTHRSASANTLISVFSWLPSARAIGAAYLRAHPADTATLALQLPAGLTRRELQFVIRDDFAHERIVTVDGWMLSVTEARLCALAHLIG